MSTERGTLAFRWFDYHTVSEKTKAEILAVYQHAFTHDIGLEFDPSLDADFTKPLSYYVPEVGGAFGVVVLTSPPSGSEEAPEETIVGTVGLRKIEIPQRCYAGVGGNVLPPRRSEEEEGVTANPNPDQASLRESLVCELKRMFILPCARGQGLSHVMVAECMAKAREMGYRAMVLDTKKRLVAANRLYEKSGFTEFTDYNDNPRADRFMIAPVPQV